MKKLISFVLIILAISLVSATTVKISTNNPEILKEINNNPEMFYFELGKMSFNAQEYEKSIEFFEKSILIDDSYAPSFHNLGVAYYNLNNLKKAEYNLLIATKLDPKYSKAHYSLGILYFENKKYNAAIKNFEQSLKYDKKNPNKNFDLAQAYVARYRSIEKASSYKDLNLALKYMKKTLQLDSNFPNAQNNLEIIEDIMKSRFQTLSPQS